MSISIQKIVNLDTFDVCFVCLEVGEWTESVSYQCVISYLNIDLKQVLQEQQPVQTTRTAPQEDGWCVDGGAADNQRTKTSEKLMVSLCSRCSGEMRDFSTRFQQLEVAKLRARNCLSRIRERMERADRDQDLVEQCAKRLSSQGDGLSTMPVSLMVDKLRCVTMDKCSGIFRSRNPEVSLVRLKTRVGDGAFTVKLKLLKDENDTGTTNDNLVEQHAAEVEVAELPSCISLPASATHSEGSMYTSADVGGDPPCTQSPPPVLESVNQEDNRSGSIGEQGEQDPVAHNHNNPEYHEGEFEDVPPPLFEANLRVEDIRRSSFTSLPPVDSTAEKSSTGYQYQTFEEEEPLRGNNFDNGDSHLGFEMTVICAAEPTTPRSNDSPPPPNEAYGNVESSSSESFNILSILQEPMTLPRPTYQSVGNGKFMCLICQKVVSSFAMVSHTSMHTGEKLYACKWCTKRFGDASAVRSHSVSVHRYGPLIPLKDPRLSDQQYGKWLRNFLSGYTERVSDWRFQCRLCDTQMANQDSAEHHLIQKHRSQFEDQLKARVQTESVLLPGSSTSTRIQLKTIKKGRKPSKKSQSSARRREAVQRVNKCYICKKTLATARNLRRHLQVHANDTTCPHCQKTCTGTMGVTSHIRRNHTGWLLSQWKHETTSEKEFAALVKQVIQIQLEKVDSNRWQRKCCLCGDLFKATWCTEHMLRKHEDVIGQLVDALQQQLPGDANDSNNRD